MNRYFPLTEGWWETYGYLVNSGMVPYRDFNLEFSPLIVFISAFYLKLTHSFFILRFFGVLLLLLSVVVIQIYLEKIFNRFASSLAILIATFLYMIDPVFIAKDYQTYQIFLVALLFLCAFGVFQVLLQIQEAFLNKIQVGYKQEIKLALYSLCMGGAIGFIALLKQNVGVFLFLSYALALVLEVRKCASIKVIFLTLVFFLAGIFSIFSLLILYFHVKEIPLSILHALFIANDSKGNKWIILFRFIIDGGIRNPLLISVSIALVFYMVLHRLKEAKDFLMTFLLNNKVNYLVIGLFFAFIVVSAIRKNLFPILEGQVIPIISLSIFWYCLLRTYFLDKENIWYQKFKFLLLPLGALIYCNTHSAGLNNIGLYFVNVFSFGYLLDCILKNTCIKRLYIVIITATLLVAIIVAKVMLPYSWWGLNQGAIYHADNELPYPETKGIYVDKATEEAFNLISGTIRKYSTSDSDVYLFPDIPIFYYLEHKKPPYRNVVQWFDVISSQHIQQELQDFRQHLPSVVIFLDPPNFVYLGHASLIKRPLIQLEFKSALDALVKAGQYVTYDYVYSQALTDFSFVNNQEVEYAFVVQNPNMEGETLSALYTSLGETDDYVVKSLLHEGIMVRHLDNNTKLHIGDRLTLLLPLYDVKNIINKVGYVFNGDYYTIRIYIKKSIIKSQAKANH
jgi:hypothetical protein